MTKIKIIIFSFLAIFLWACEEDIIDVNKHETGRFSIESAKAWYESHAPSVKPNGLLTKSVNDDDLQGILNLQPILDWNIAELSNDSVWDAVELPWEYEDAEEIFALSEVWEYAGANNLMPEQVVKLVVIRHRQRGDIYGFKMKIAPDLDYMLDSGDNLRINKYLVRDSDLSGIVIFCSLDDRFINGWRYMDGVIQGKLVPANVEDAGTRATLSGTRSEDWHIVLDEIVIVGYGPKGLMHANMYTQENGYLVFPADEMERPGGVDTSGPVVDTYGGSGNSDNDSSGDILLPVPLDGIINSHILSPLQLGKLEKALKELINEGCMQETLYNALVSNNVKLDFGMYANPTETSAPANYDPRERSIKFKDNSSITKDNLKEEFFHAWQDSYYSCGIWQYRETGKVNVEFEAKVFKDIIESPDATCCWAFGDVENLPENLSTEYGLWIYGIRESSISLQDADYRKWLNLYNQYNTEYSFPMHQNLSTPNAIRSLINQSDCY